MDKKTLLIIDDNQCWCDILKKEIESCGFFNVATPLHNGKDAIECISTSKPDVIILDMLIPEYDGLYIISYLHQNMVDYHPFIYVISAIGTDRTIQIMNNLNVDYYSIKPIQGQAVASNLCKLVIGTERDINKNHIYTDAKTNKLQSIDLDKYIEDYLYDIGAPLYRLSTQCMHTMLRICLLDESKLGNLAATYKIGAREMSPAITHLAFTRNIRSTIQNISKAQTQYFEECFADKTKKVTSSYFIDVSIYRIKCRIEESLSD